MSVIKVRGCQYVSGALVYGLRESIKRAKYPMAADIRKLDFTLTDGIAGLAKSAAGAGHDQWLTGIVVQFDLTFSNKAWVEAERYHFFDFVSSQSTMHRITRFDLDRAYNHYVDPRIVEIMKEKVQAYNALCAQTEAETDEAVRKRLAERRAEAYLGVLYSNPAGFQLTAGMTTNYRQLKTIYAQRKNHRLPEWRAFCKWIEALPCAELICSTHNE